MTKKQLNAKAWYEKNKEITKARAAARYWADPEAASLYHKKHRQENKEKISEYERKRYLENKTERIAYISNWQKENKEKRRITCRKWSKRHPEQVLDITLKRNFGISLAEYNDMLALQNHCCGICKRHKSEFKKRLAVDHCHKTGKVRKLLCIPCNTLLGLARDNVNTLSQAIDYLKEFET